jgi:hypothetical protein
MKVNGPALGAAHCPANVNDQNQLQSKKNISVTTTNTWYIQTMMALTDIEIHTDNIKGQQV